MPFVVQVHGFTEFRAAVKAAAPELDKELQKTLRASIQPIAADARARLSALGGTGPKTAERVRTSVTKSAVAVGFTAVGGYEFGREFGAKGYRVSHYEMRTRRGRVSVTRAINYAKPSIFGPWTGNRFTLDSGVSGHGVFPAAAAGGERAVAEITAAMDRIVNRMGD